MNKAEQYIKDVLAGREMVCKYVRLAVERHVRDLDTGQRRGLLFDHKRGAFMAAAMETLHFWHGAKAGQRVQLEPYQWFMIYTLYGWKAQRRNEHGQLMRDAGGNIVYRQRYSNAYTEIARKNGKTTMCSLKALIHIQTSHVGSAVFCGANKEDQAMEVVSDAGKIAKSTPWLAQKMEYKQRQEKVSRLIYPQRQSIIAAVGSDSLTLDGLKPTYSIIDEFHAAKTSEILNVLRSGMVFAQNPMLDIITTAGFNKNGPCYQKRKVVADILEGKVEDDNTFAIIYTLDEDDNWQDERNWYKANPNIGKSLDIENFRAEYQTALNEKGEAEVGFKTKNLNIWCDAPKTWIADADYMACATRDWPELSGRRAWVGLDLSSNKDLTCLAVLVEGEEDMYMHHYFFLPEDAVESDRGGQIGYRRWVSDGHITATPGNVIDYTAVRSRLREICNQYQVVRIGYDPWNAIDFCIQMTDEGYPMFKFNQNFSNLNAPTKELERLVLGRRILHDGNPVMRWMMSNVSLKRDGNGNIRIDKQRSADKVDGPAATVIAIGEYMTPEDAPVYYVGGV